MSAISIYTNMIRNFGLELDESDKDYIKTILINIMSRLEISIVPTEILTMLDEERRHEILPLLTDTIHFGEDENGQIIDSEGETICNLHNEFIDPDVLIPLSISLIKDGLELQEVQNRDEVEELLSTLKDISKSIDPVTLELAKLKSQRVLLDKRSNSITEAYFRNINRINRTIAANEQLRELLTRTGKERKEINRKITALEQQSVKGMK